MNKDLYEFQKWLGNKFDGNNDFTIHLCELTIEKLKWLIYRTRYTNWVCATDEGDGITFYHSNDNKGNQTQQAENIEESEIIRKILRSITIFLGLQAINMNWTYLPERRTIHIKLMTYKDIEFSIDSELLIKTFKEISSLFNEEIPAQTFTTKELLQNAAMLETHNEHYSEAQEILRILNEMEEQ